MEEINNLNKNFRGQQKNEVVYCFSRKHWIVIAPHIIGFVVFIAGIASFFVFAPHADIKAFMGEDAYRSLMLMVLFVLTFYLNRFFLRMFNYYLKIFIITNIRIVELSHTLYFTRNSESVDIHEIQELEIHQKGLLPTVLNYGDIIATLSSAYSTRTIHCVPNPEYYFRKINKTQAQAGVAR